MKVIFLDVDGVLNSESYCDWVMNNLGYDNGYGGFFPPEAKPRVEDVKWDPETVRVLQHIVEETGANIVMSSTWRHNFPLERFNDMFALYGAHFNIISATPSAPRRMSSFQGFRGDEVNQWLSETIHDIESYVILDDGVDFYEDQSVIYTNDQVGLTWNDADAAIRKLGGSGSNG